MFPLAPAELRGKSILLITILPHGAAAAQFLVGEARWTGSELWVRYHSARPAVCARGSPAALAGYDPAILPRFIAPTHLATVTALAATVQAWVAVFTTECVEDVLTLSMPFSGLAERADGAALLFEGAPDDDWMPEHDEPEPDEPWRSSAPVT